MRRVPPDRAVRTVYNAGMASPDDPLRYLTLQFLDWIAAAPRTYGEAIDAWRTSCPRLAVWEEANERGFLEYRPNGAGTLVAVSALGAKFLAQRRT